MRNCILLTGLVFLFVMIGCKGNPPPDRPHHNGDFIQVKPTDDDAYEAFTPAALDHFNEVDGKVVDGEYKPLELSKLEIKGRNAWMLWTGGNELFWDWLSKNGYGSLDLLKVIESDSAGEKRKTRFARAGLINEPGMRPPTPDETEKSYGIRYDRPNKDYYKNNYFAYDEPDPNVYGYPTGVVGLRIFENPEFKNNPSAQRKWKKNQDRFYSEKPEDKAFASNPKTIKPYVVGMSCAICHVSFHPLNPPADVAEPEWKNISSTIGAQFLRIRSVFGNTLEDKSYLYHVIDSHLPGTVDTSLIATDNINNANTMNAIFDLKSRLVRSLANPPETLSKESYGPLGNRYPGVWDSGYNYNEYGNYPPPFEKYKPLLEGNPRHVPRVLVDGSDSVGTWVALARVYLNIGTYHQQWIRTHNTILGFRDQTPFSLKDCEDNSVYWHATRVRTDSLTAYFLKSTDPMLLKDAIVDDESFKKFPEMESKGEPAAGNPPSAPFTGLPDDPALAKARRVFAKGCIACHSSKQPDYPGLAVVEPVRAKTLDIADLWRLTHGDGELPDDYARWAQWAVETKDYFKDNYLSTDMRVPVTMTGTSSARAMATNAKHGQVWEDFASNTFKDLDSVGPIKYRDPFSGAVNSYDSPSGGPGYYRVPTLISAWATAPFFHNNSLGKFNNDPSVQGRLEAFDDAIDKLLWPEKRFESSHDQAKLNNSAVVSPAQLKADGGLIWRTSARSNFEINGHQVPSFISGFTGFTAFWVALIPWLPALALLIIGLLLLLRDRIQPIWEWIENKNPRTVFIFMLGRALAILISIALGVASTYLLWKYVAAIRMVEVGSGWLFPWITVQAIATIVLLFIIAALIFVKKSRLSKFAAVFFILAAIFFGLGFGRFASGLGGDLSVGPFPKGMPVNLVVNIDSNAPLKDLAKAAKALTSYFQRHADGQAGDAQELLDFEQTVAPVLMSVSKCPDLVLDRGHDYKFIQQLTDDEKQALKTLIKTF